MAKQIISYQANDGSVFETEAEAVFHETRGALIAQLADVFSEYVGGDQFEGWNFEGVFKGQFLDEYSFLVEKPLANFLASNLDKINDWFGYKPAKEQPKTKATGILPMTRPPELGASYYVVDLSHYDYCVRKVWNSSPSHFASTELARGLCHKTKKAAVAHARALLEFITRGEE